jgi:hypothetical protein
MYGTCKNSLLAGIRAQMGLSYPCPTSGTTRYFYANCSREATKTVDRTTASSYGLAMAETDQIEMRRDLLDTVQAQMALGAFCAAALKKVGVVTLVVLPDESVSYCSPLQVHILRDAIPEPRVASLPFHYVRPIVTDGRPKFVAWKDGELWEIAFEEPTNEPTEEGNGEEAH